MLSILSNDDEREYPLGGRGGVGVSRQSEYILLCWS